MLAPGQIVPGDGVFGCHQVLDAALGHHLAAHFTCTRANVNQIVGGPQGVLVMLHHNQGIAKIPQALEGGQKAVVVPLVQADGGLIQDVEHPNQPGADLGRQADTLGLAAG